MIITNLSKKGKTSIPLAVKLPIARMRKSLDDSDNKRSMVVRIPLTNLEVSPMDGKSYWRRPDSASPSLAGSTLKKLPNRFNHQEIEILPPLLSATS